MPFDQGHETGHRRARSGDELRQHIGVPHGGKNRAAAFLAGRQQPFHRHVAQAARRDVGDAQQADVVVRVDEGLEVGQEILDFAPVKKALAADEVIADAGLAQGGFQRARLLVGAEEDRLLPPGRRGAPAGRIRFARRCAAPPPRRRNRCAEGFSRPALFGTTACLGRRRTLFLMTALAAERMVLVER